MCILHPAHNHLIGWGGLDSVLNLDRRARQTPGAAAFFSPGRERLTYAGLLRVVEAFRAQLIRADLIPGQVIALVLPNGPDFATTVLACTGLGACAPFDPSLTQDEYEYFFSRLRAPVLLTLEGFETAAVAAARRVGMRILRVQFASNYRVKSLVSDGQASLRDVRVANASLLLFTSATTGRSKLVPITAASLGTQWANDTRAFELDASDVFLNLVPMFNLFGIGAIFLQLYSGGAAVCVPEFEPIQLPAWMEQYRPTWVSLNSVWHRSLEELVRQSPALWSGGRLRFIRSGGMTQDIHVLADLERITGVPVLDAYGMTETGGIARSTRRSRKPGSAGRSTGTEIAIVDASHHPVSPGEEGEIAVRGPNVMSGYLDDEDANREAFVDGWFRTGDLGRLDPEGFLFITGRLKEIISRGGVKIIPQDVDRVLLEHPSVADAAVFGIPHPTLGEEIAAAVVLKTSEPPVAESVLRNFAALHASAYKVPRHIAFVDQLPRGATGRIQRKKLAERFRDIALKGGKEAPGEIDLEISARLAKLWKRILKVPQVNPGDSFYDLGGDSLSAALMLAEVRREFNIGPELLDRIEFFEKPTAATLVQILADTRRLYREMGMGPAGSPDPAECRLLTLNDHGSGPAVFCLPASEADPFYFRHLAKALGRGQSCFAVPPPPPVEGNRLLTIEEIAARASSAILAKQRQGPYLLIGHCYGGVIAVEVVRQLRAQGADVPRLILLDCLTPGYPKIRDAGARYVTQGVEAGRAVLRGKLLFSRKDLAAHFRRVLTLATRGLTVRRQNAQVARGQVPAPDASNSSLFLLNRAVVTRYNIPEIDIPIVHFMARDHQVDALVLSDPRFGWRDFARAGLQERWVPGDHNTLLMNENAPGLADEIRVFLGSASLAATR